MLLLLAVEPLVEGVNWSMIGQLDWLRVGRR